MSLRCLPLLALLPVVALAAEPAGKPAPNVVFIVADDLGYGDIQCYGNPYVDTPVLNRLAQEGARFTDYYAPSPLCAPSRAGMLTGRYNHRTGAVDVSSNRGIDRIDLSEKTIGDYFKSAGYATALVGKWHSGLYCDDYLPRRRGFDHFFGFANGAQDYWKWNLFQDDTTLVHDGRYLTVALHDAAISFIEHNRNHPFMLVLAEHAPHEPFQAPDALIEKYRQRLAGKYSNSVAILYAMIEAMDAGIGDVLAKIDALGLRENTIVVFVSDNGAALGRGGQLKESMDRYHASFRGNKDNVLEEGIRVPAIINWRGTIKPGQTISTPVHGCDWLPTLFARTGAPPPPGAKPLDGKDIFPLVQGRPTRDLLERVLPFQKNRYTPVAHSDAAIRRGPWKLFWPGATDNTKKDLARDNWSYERGLIYPHWEMPLDPELPPYEEKNVPAPELYNLVEDPGERNNVAAQHPDLVAELAATYNGWFDDVNAEWRESNRRIRDYDVKYWANRPKPDPLPIITYYWTLTRGHAPTAEDHPLDDLTGYWNYWKQPKDK